MPQPKRAPPPRGAALSLSAAPALLTLFFAPPREEGQRIGSVSRRSRPGARSRGARRRIFRGVRPAENPPPRSLVAFCATPSRGGALFGCGTGASHPVLCPSPERGAKNRFGFAPKPSGSSLTRGEAQNLLRGSPRRKSTPVPWLLSAPPPRGAALSLPAPSAACRGKSTPVPWLLSAPPPRGAALFFSPARAQNAHLANAAKPCYNNDRQTRRVPFPVPRFPNHSDHGG